MKSTPLRFGITGMQMAALVPAAGGDLLASLASLTHVGLVRSLAEQGFRHIELGGDLVLFFPHFFSPASIAELDALKREYDLSYSVHLPLWSVEPSTPLEAVRAGSTQALIDSIRATQPLDPETYVLHATGPLAAEFSHMRLPAAARALLLRQFQAGALRSLETILRETGIATRKLAVETIEFPFDLNDEMVQRLDLSWCLDTGHILAGFSGPIQLPEALERVLPRLAEVHLHDSPWQGPDEKMQYGKDHQALGLGDVDVPYLLDRLQAAHFRGPLVFELSVPEALASLEYIQGLSQIRNP